MTHGPPPVWIRLARLVLRSAPAALRAEIEGDLIELWQRRHAGGRRDLRRALIRDLTAIAWSRSSHTESGGR